MDYRLQVEFTAKQRDHLDTLRAQGIPAGVYLRGLVNRDMAQPETFKGVGGISTASPAQVSEAGAPSTFNEAYPQETRESGGTST